jgi:GntR family transcriptional regulator/MocR family aminotransferase
MDLDIPLDRTSTALLSHQIGRALADMIGTGLLSPGARLPPTRELARRLSVARTTIVEAYGWLTDQGYVEARQGSGTTVRETGLKGPTASSPSAQRLSVPATAARAAIDFRPGLPDLDSFPQTQWQSALAQAARRLGTDSLGYGEPLGWPRLRRAVAAYLNRSRGLAVDPETVVITAGAAQSVHLFLSLFPERRELILETPSPANLLKLPEAYPVTLTLAPVDEQGLRTDLLPTSGPPPLAYVTPSHHMPMGCALSIERRSALVAWAGARDAYLFEDDYDSEFAFDGRPAVPLAKLDHHGRVFYSGTVSKTLAPSLRLAFLIVPPAHLERTRAMKRWLDYGGWPVAQDALASWIEEGAFERHVYRMRKLYRSRYSLLVRELTKAFGERARIAGEPVGMHMPVFIQTSRSAEEVAAAARQEGVGLYPIEGPSGAQPGEAAFVIGFGAVATADIPAGIDAFERAARTPSP